MQLRSHPQPSSVSGDTRYEAVVLQEFFAKKCPQCEARNDLDAKVCTTCDQEIAAVRRALRAVVEEGEPRLVRD